MNVEASTDMRQNCLEFCTAGGVDVVSGHPCVYERSSTCINSSLNVEMRDSFRKMGGADYNCASTDDGRKRCYQRPECVILSEASRGEMEALRNGNVKEVYKSGLNSVTEKLNSLDLSNNNSSISNNDCRFPKSAPSRLSSGGVFFFL
ncbi:hypothetical protein RB195_023880 [Necator americanus]|uniref:PAN domain protein n=1 Tax=Necator americanus TaxID=51031 RepID=A0ABR1EL12_NECAM